MIANVVGGIVMLTVLSLAVRYIVKSKKNGAKCIGCPNGCECCKNKSC